jgi:spore maturation protein CgeB
MSSGAFYLTDYFGGIETVFEKEFHLDWFRGIPDAIDSVKFYMEIDSLREEIADQGSLQVLGRHTWDNRVAKMMEYVEGLDES